MFSSNDLYIIENQSKIWVLIWFDEMYINSFHICNQSDSLNSYSLTIIANKNHLSLHISTLVLLLFM